MGFLRSGLPDAQRCPVPTRDGWRERERDENFPVALRVLPKAVRMNLRAVYAVSPRHAAAAGWMPGRGGGLQATTRLPNTYDLFSDVSGASQWSA